METQKYIKTELGEIIIFPKSIEHDAFKFLNPKTAGFCDITENKVKCYGSSFSLNLSADTVEDTLLATKQLHGIEAFLKLI